MGYQVGRLCFQTKEDATNEVMTHVLPTIDKDGVLHHPIFDGKTWSYNEVQINLTFPTCDDIAIAQNAKQLGMSLVGAFIAMYVVILLKKTILIAESKDND